MKSRESRSSGTIKYLRFSGLFLQMGVFIAAGAMGGLWLDRHWTCSPWCTLSGILLALFVSFYMIIKELKYINHQNEQDVRENNKAKKA
ncbi:MAG: AtpZ/AtpI family protein [Bacteroidales bacterium]|jgi:F0F1-type ATP synthase assembly protein I|nr:AtpZ/AtpI family protein [Bacteroidales bacterium]